MLSFASVLKDTTQGLTCSSEQYANPETGTSGTAPPIFGERLFNRNMIPTTSKTMTMMPAIIQCFRFTHTSVRKGILSLAIINRYFTGIHQNIHLISILNPWNGHCDHLQKGWVLEVADLCFGMGIIHPSIIFHISKNYLTTRKRKMFGRMLVRPFDVVEGMLRLEHLERMRANVNV